MKNARWVRLADDLTRGITNGDYPLDSYLPTEMELCEKYNVSRYTVRLALADLTLNEVQVVLTIQWRNAN